MPRPSVAVVSQAVGPPWIDGIINAMVATAREMPDFDFHWFGDKDWHPTEPHFLNHSVGTVGSWGIADKARYISWVKSLDVDIAHVTFHPRPPTIRMLRPLLRKVSVVQTIQTRQRSLDDLGSLLLTDDLIAVTQRIGRDLAEVAPNARSTVVPPAVDLERLPTNIDTRSVRDQFGLSGEGPVVLYAGNYTASLGVVDAAEIFAGLSEALPDAQFVMANRRRANEEANVVEKVASVLRPLEHRVTMLDTVPNFLELLAASDALVFPAYQFDEHKLDMPLVILEALSMSIAVASYQVEPLDELPAGLIDCVAEPGDTKSLVHQLTGLLGRGESTCGRQGTGLLDQWSPTATAELLRSVYRRVLAADSN